MDIKTLKAKSLELAEKRKKYNNKNMEYRDTTEVNCGCGSVYKAYIKHQHSISKRHIKWLESQQPVEEFTTYTVGEKEVGELKRAEDKIIELALALNSRDNKLNRLQSVLGDCKSIDTITIKQMTELCQLVLDLNK